jgi:large-conductance mechanosensitive channel
MTEVSELIILACAVYIGSVFKEFMVVFMKDFVYPILHVSTIHSAFGSSEIVQRLIDFLIGLIVIVVIIRVVQKPFLKLISAIGN